MRFKKYEEFHSKGMISISDDFKMFDHDLHDVDLGCMIDDAGKLWLCINGISFVRFKPHFIKNKCNQKDDTENLL